MSGSKKQQQFIEMQKKLFKNKVVIQKNDFIKGDTSVFSVNDLKIFKLLISKVKTQETLFDNYYEISTDEIKALNIKEVHLHRETVQSLKKLANIYVKLDTEDGSREVGLIRNDFKFPKYSKSILVTFNEDMREYLLDIKGNYTKYSLIDIVNFKLKHTLKLYEYIKSVNLTVMKVKLDTLKKVLDLIGKYERFGELKRNVLDPCINEINEKTLTLNVAYSLQKENRDVVMIVFHIQRFDMKNLAKPNTLEKHKYEYLIGETCLHFDKYYNLEDIDYDKNMIQLKEIHSDNRSSLIVSSETELENTLKALFKEKFENKKIIEGSISEDEEPDEMSQLKDIKDFKKFREKIIEEYRNKPLLNNAPNFLEDTVIQVNDIGLLVNSKTSTIMTKEESLEIWKYLFNNKDKVGVIKKINPIKKFLNIILNIEKNNKITLEKEKYLYRIIEIDEESENAYRLKLQDYYDETCIETSKSVLTYEQLEHLVNTSKIS